MDSFFTKDKQFYKTLFSLFIVIALQNLVAYSVNMLDNIMLGSYSQSALSGAATVNQIFFLVNQTALAIGNAFVAIASQYWSGYWGCSPQHRRSSNRGALIWDY